MFTALEQIPYAELAGRHARCRELLARLAPEAGGMLVCSRVEIYYLTGTLASGLFWLPLSGEPVLLTRRGVERARLESPLRLIASFRSYRDLAGICAEAGSPLPPCIAVDKAGFSWSMGDLLQKHLPGTRFTSCDLALRKARAVKSEWELRKLRLCGERHRAALEESLPERLSPGMTELEIAHLVHETFCERGNGVVTRMYAHGEENHGLLAVGDSGLYPTYYNGPLGARGLHPSIPYLGDAGTVWRPHTLLTVDVGFTVEGYNTDKTQVYWSGDAASLPQRLIAAHAACEEAYRHCAERLRPGLAPSQLWREVLEMMERAGQAEDFMGMGGNKVAFLGHGTGLTVDDLPVFAAGFDEPLEEGMVVAVEPKIAIPGIGLTGVENTFEIMAQGARSLSGSRIGIIPLS